MLRACWTADGLEVRDVELGRLEPGWVRLRVAACGICGSDLHFWHDELPRTVGTAPGHELVGTVLDGPAGLPDHLYAVSPNIICGRCEFCRSGMTNHCTRAGPGLGLGRDGGLAEEVDVPVDNLASLLTDVDPVLASLTEPVAVALRGVTRAQPQPDTRALVLGGGTIGLCAALLLRDRVAMVAQTARYPHQRAAAERLGVVALAEGDAAAWGKQHQPDVVVETVGGKADTLSEAVRVARRGGRIVVLGTFSEAKHVDLKRLMMKELTIGGSFCYGSTERGAEFASAAALVDGWGEELRPIATHQFPLAEVGEAFATAGDKHRLAIKVTITP